MTLALGLSLEATSGGRSKRKSSPVDGDGDSEDE
jgi:hypothetical protein